MESDATFELARAVAKEIMDHLRANISAADTSEGIWRWWLTDLREKVDVAMVEEILQKLASQGEIGTRVLASGATLYFGLGVKNQTQS